MAKTPNLSRFSKDLRLNLNHVQLEIFPLGARVQQLLFNFGTRDSSIPKLKTPKGKNGRFLLGKTTVLDVDRV